MDRLEYVLKAKQNGRMVEQVFCAFLGASPREDFIPYVADFYLQLEDVKWTIVAGIVNDSLVMSVRNLGYSRNAGEFVRKYFADIGSAGGHRVDGEGGRAAARVPRQVRQPAGRSVHRQGPHAGARVPPRAPAVGQEARQSLTSARAGAAGRRQAYEPDGLNSARSIDSPIAL